MAHCARSRASHVISDLQDMLAADSIAQLDLLEPPPDADNATKEKAYDDMANFLDASRDRFVDVVPCICCPSPGEGGGAPWISTWGTHLGDGDPLTILVAGIRAHRSQRGEHVHDRQARPCGRS